MIAKTGLIILITPLFMTLFGCNHPSAQQSGVTQGSSHMLAQSVTIYRDEYHVPHVVGPTDASVVFGVTYARAEDEFDYMEQAYIKLMGQAASVSGPRWMEWDIFLRRLELTKHAQQEYQAAPDRVKKLCDAFAAGLNYFLLKNPQVKPKLVTHFEPWHALLGYRLFHVSGIGEQTLKQIGQPNVLELFTGYLSSTMWAIDGRKTATGQPMLFINPHIPLDAPYEFSMHSDEGLNITGQTAYGIGILPISGHNAEMGWAITANTPDINDVYVESFDANDPLKYRYDDKEMTVHTWSENIKVKTAKGVQLRQMTFEKSIHGPLFNNSEGQRVALKVSKLAEGGVLEQFYDMSLARNITEFKAAIRPMNITYNNILYAGSDGHIFYVYGGAIPKRDPAFDWSNPVDGSTSQTEWKDYFTLDELPNVIDPKSGYLQNSNSTPFLVTDTDNPEAGDFPSYIFRDDGEQDTAIAQRSREILSNLEQVTFDEWSALAFDTYIPTADESIQTINKEYNQLKLLDPDTASKLEQAVTILNNWDRRSAVDSVASTLYFSYFHTWENEVEYPSLDRLASSMETLSAAYGDWQIAIGDFIRLQRDIVNANPQESLPSAGLPFYMGSIFTFNTNSNPVSKLNIGHHGHSYVSVVELANPVKSRSIMAYGQSRDPVSKHYNDQSSLYTKGQLKAALFDLQTIRKRAVKAYHPGD